jgi:hypothetical protein
MLILRAFLALLAGFVSMALLVGAVTAVVMKLAPAWVGPTNTPGTGYVIFNLGYSLAAAAIGGYITAWLVRDNPLIHALALALIVLLLAALSALQQRGMQPIWYQLLLTALTPVGVMAGALLQLRVSGRL